MDIEKSEFDAIIAGSGPGGATVARELSLAGKRVLILEWGDNDPVKGTFSDIAPRAYTPGKGMLFTGQGLGVIRGITTGGSSVIYCATAFDPPFDMLKAHGVDITREVSQMREEIPNDTLQDHLVSPAGECFARSALDLGYDCKPLKKLIYQDKCRPDCDRCLYGCPYEAKWTARNFVDQAIENGSRIINRARVKKVLFEDRKAVGVEYKKDGASRRAFARHIIIAAGGVGSPVILKNSGVRNVGTDFFFDPLIFVYGKVNTVKSGRGLCMSSGIHFPEDGIVMTDFNLPLTTKVLFDMEIFRFDRLFSHADVVPIMIKVRDSLGGRVINDRLIWKTLTKEDKQKLNKGAQHAARILKNAGAADIYRSWYVAAHPGGTVKIGEHVDSDLKTRFDHLYVCDCSVIPKEWGLPPSLTLLGLGKRLANHLTGRTSTAEK